MHLALDLSLKCSGWAKFSKDGRLIDRGRISPSPDLDNCMKIHYITTKIRDLFVGVEYLVIEDLFYGKNFLSVKWLARLSGAVATAWVDYKYTIPKFYTASQARKLAGVNGRSHKAEVQIFILTKYKFAKPKKLKSYQTKIDELKDLFGKKEIKKGSFKYQLDKLSKQIDKDTKIGEDIADSIILGLAYKKEKDKK